MPSGLFELDPEQQFALRIQRPGIAEFAVLRLRNAPDRRGARLRAAAAGAEAQWARFSAVLTVAPRAGLAAHPLHRGRQERIDCLEMMRVAAALDKGAHRAGILGLTQENAVHAAAEDLAELPGIEADIGGVGAVDRRFDDNCRGAVTRAGRAALDEALHVLAKPRHVEGAVLHADIDVVGPGAGIRAALRAGQHMAGMGADVIDCLVLRQQLDRAVDAARHDSRLLYLQYAVLACPHPNLPRSRGRGNCGRGGEHE
jgi:hypothetical protein